MENAAALKAPVHQAGAPFNRITCSLSKGSPKRPRAARLMQVYPLYVRANATTLGRLEGLRRDLEIVIVPQFRKLPEWRIGTFLSD
jgi:hypothetical protein